MARLAGVDLPRNKRMEVALTYIYGIGPARSKQLLKETGISPDLRTDNLTDEQIASLRDVIEATWKVEGDLRRQVQADIRRKIEIGCYQGLRHRRGLPVRGQRTKTNARTRKGPKKTIEERTWSPYRPPRREEECGAGRRIHQVHLQQHHRVHHGPQWCCDLLGILRPRRLQGFPQVHSVRCTAGC